MRRRRRPGRARWLGLAAALVIANTMLALTATNSVPPSAADNPVADVDANDLKPPECAALDLTRVEGGPLVTGSAANDLLLGTELGEVIDGNGGDDCIVGGPGADTLSGGPGTDVCLGGPDTDTFIGCEDALQ
jgi:Ca2+-binding RTX toxin-like protein